MKIKLTIICIFVNICLFSQGNIDSLAFKKADSLSYELLKFCTKHGISIGIKLQNRKFNQDIILHNLDIIKKEDEHNIRKEI